MQAQEKALRQELDQISKQLEDPAAYATKEGQAAAKRQAEIQELLELIEEYKKVNKQYKETHELISSNDPEIASIAQEEYPDLVAKENELKARLEERLMPKDPTDDKNAIVEIRAGAGGDEASLFGGDLYRMYARFSEKQGWRLELVSESASEAGGFKEIVFKVSGSGAYGKLKYESGVHRVQRIPVTESGGRIHTSTATVAVLPEAEEQDIEINPSDLRIDVFRSSGPGGQSVNTTDSAVRITHVPTGLVVTCQDEKSQHKNKDKAMKVLRSRLLDMKIQAEQKARAQTRKSQIGTGDRSEKIRTYNFPQDRVTDHRIKASASNLPGFMDGNISELLEKLAQADRDALETSLE